MLFGILLVAANLRTGVAALSPIVDYIRADVSLDGIQLALLGTLAPLCFGIFGLLTPLINRWLSLELLIVVGLAAVTLGHIGRSGSPSFAALAASSTITFAAAGVGNVAIPPLVKKYFAHRLAEVSTAYATLAGLSTLTPPLLAVPIAASLGWRTSLGMWAALSVVAILPWLFVWRRSRRLVDTSLDLDPPTPGRVWRTSLGWALAILFGVVAMNVFATFAWLPAILTDLGGTTAATAGAMLALYGAISVPLALVVPTLSVRLPTVIPLIVGGSITYITGYVGLLVAPAFSPLLWVVMISLGTMIFPLTILLINLRTRTGPGAVALSGFTQGVGYLVGALGPFLVGVLHSVTRAWTLSLAVLLATVAVILVTGFIVARPVMLEDQWVRRR